MPRIFDNIEETLLSAVAHKCGMVAFRCEGPLPHYPTRRRIERQVAIL